MNIQCSRVLVGSSIAETFIKDIVHVYALNVRLYQ